MNIRIYRGLLMASVIIFPLNATAGDFETLFKKTYRSEVLPELRMAKTDKLKSRGLSRQEIERTISQLADKAADCQFKTFQAYSKKHRKLAHQALLKGENTEDATFALNDALADAVQQGKVSKKEYDRRSKKAMKLYSECVIKQGLLEN